MSRNEIKEPSLAEGLFSTIAIILLELGEMEHRSGLFESDKLKMPSEYLTVSDSR
jgi:hypothetical protein